MAILSVRLDDEIDKKLKLILELRKIQDKSAYVRRILLKSIQEDIIEDYCQRIKDAKITMWKAAEIIGISLREMMNEVGKREIILYNEEAMEQDFKFAGFG